MITISRNIQEINHSVPAQAGIVLSNLQFSDIKNIHAWTDGSCIKGAGGYAVLFDNGEILSGSGYMTNQAAEMMAIELVFNHVPDNSRIFIHSDSAFAIGAIAKYWNLQKSPHLQAIQRRVHDEIIHRHIRYQFVKVKGHSGDYHNNVVDREARQQAERLCYGLP